MTRAPEPYGTVEEELDAERENGDRLAAALRLVVRHIDDDARHLIIGPPDCQFCLGYVIEGALALHEREIARRPL